MSAKRQQPAQVVVALGATGLLLLAALGDMPYGFYLLLRWVCFAVYGYLAIRSWTERSAGWAWTWGIVAAIYNPFFRVGFPRSTWEVVNCLTLALVVFAIISWYRAYKDTKEGNSE